MRSRRFDSDRRLKSFRSPAERLHLCSLGTCVGGTIGRRRWSFVPTAQPQWLATVVLMDQEVSGMTRASKVLRYVAFGLTVFLAVLGSPFIIGETLMDPGGFPRSCSRRPGSSRWPPWRSTRFGGRRLRPRC